MFRICRKWTALVMSLAKLNFNIFRYILSGLTRGSSDQQKLVLVVMEALAALQKLLFFNREISLL